MLVLYLGSVLSEIVIEDGTGLVGESNRAFSCHPVFEFGAVSLLVVDVLFLFIVVTHV
nr:hypothetical protein [Halorubrum sp. CGM5_25_10-8B]